MKICVIGGGGVRAPLLLFSFAKRRALTGTEIDEVSIYDIDAEKSAVMLRVAALLLQSEGFSLNYRHCRELEAALDGADVVILTIREGFEKGRAADERICLENGVIGQETTGAAGFAFASRSVPAVLRYAEIAVRLNPRVKIINFTNPSGMISQALVEAGFTRSYGICDSADAIRRYACAYKHLDEDSVGMRVSGLNHLSWTYSLKHRGEELIGELSNNDRFLDLAGLYSIKGFVKGRAIPAIPNEYLYYYYKSAECLAAMKKSRMTRGEEVEALNEKLIDDLKKSLAAGDEEMARTIYMRYLKRRTDTYMSYAGSRESQANVRGLHEFEDGYAKTAFDLLEAFYSEGGKRIVLNIYEKGFGTVEKSCTVCGNEVTPDEFDYIPEEDRLLVERVKEYENLALASIRDKSLSGAVKALSAHPLVSSVEKAGDLARAFAAAHPEVFKDWR